MLMKASEGVVKVEPDDNFLKWSNLNVGPFKIQHGSAEKKMVFVPTQGSWTNFQNAKYAAYILANKNKMENRPQCKLWQLYKEMSLFITSRNFRQCKTHHQRLTQISVTFSGIINYLRNTIEDFNSLLTIQMQCYKNFQAKNSDQKIPAENPQAQNVPQQVISPTDKKQTDGPTADSYVPEPMKGFPPILNQNVLGSTFPICMPPYQPSKSTAEEWLECHNLFLQWTKKLQQLNSMSSYY